MVCLWKRYHGTANLGRDYLDLRNHDKLVLCVLVNMLQHHDPVDFCERVLDGDPHTKTSGKNENTPLRQASAPTERTCLLSTQKKNCAPQHRCTRKKTWVSTRTCERPSVHTIKNFPHAFARFSTRFRTVCLRIDFACHWTRHDIVSRRMRFSARQQLMSSFTRISIFPSRTDHLPTCAQSLKHVITTDQTEDPRSSLPVRPFVEMLHCLKTLAPTCLSPGRPAIRKSSTCRVQIARVVPDSSRRTRKQGSSTIGVQCLSTRSLTTRACQRRGASTKPLTHVVNLTASVCDMFRPSMTTGTGVANTALSLRSPCRNAAFTSPL